MDKTFSEANHILMSLPHIISWKNKQLNYEGCNEGFVQFFKIKSSHVVVGKNDSALFKSKEIVRMLSEGDKLILQGKRKNYNVEKTIRLNESSPHTLIISKTPIYNDNHIIGIIMLAIDVEDIKSQDKRYLEEVIAHLTGYIFWKNKKLEYMGCNNKLLEIFGLNSREDIIGKTDFELPWKATQAKAFRADDRKIIQTGISKLNIEEKVTQANGQIATVLTNKVPLHDIDGNISGVLAISSDITELNNAVEALKIAKEKAEAANLAKTEFIAVISHELRTPLNGFLGMFDYLFARPNATINEIKEVLDDMQHSSNILLNLVNDILDFAKLEAGKLEFIHTCFDLRELIEESTNNLSILVKQKGLEIFIDYQDDIPRFVISDVKRIRQVLFNLIGNAIKFTEKGYIMVSVECLKKMDNEAILKIFVKDTGIGFPDDKRIFIFEKFNQLEPGYQSENRGTGLGLSIVKQIVDNLGGEIGVKSKVKKGSTFWFSLPIQLQEKTEDVAIASQLSKTLKIWIIDDNPTRAKVMHDQIPITNVNVYASTHLSVLLSVTANKIPDIIIIDDEIHHMKPFNLLKKIKAEKKLKDVKVILSTKPILDTKKEEAKKNGFAKCLIKPFQPTELLDTILGLSMRKENEFSDNRQKKSDKQHRILLVEDNVINQKVASMLLKDLSCEVVVVDDGVKALSRLQNEKFDMIFLDIGLEGMSGYEIASAIRKLHNVNKRRPVIAMTAHASEQAKMRCLEIGMDDVIFKPIDMIVLKQVIDRWI